MARQPKYTVTISNGGNALFYLYRGDSAREAMMALEHKLALILLDGGRLIERNADVSFSRWTFFDDSAYLHTTEVEYRCNR